MIRPRALRKASGGISNTLDASQTNGKITVGSSSVTFYSVEQLIITETIYSDTLLGGNGNDLLTGGNGADVFYFFAPDEGVDTITNFSVAEDIIEVYNVDFGSDLIGIAALGKVGQARCFWATATHARRFDPRQTR